MNDVNDTVTVTVMLSMIPSLITSLVVDPILLTGDAVLSAGWCC